MKEYHNLVKHVLENGSYKKNRTDSDTISSFSYSYKIDLEEGYPLITTKKMDNFRWDSMLYEFFWYLSGEEHVRNLREKTSIWDEWADEDGNLDTSYARFWRRYPIPDKKSQLKGEVWVDENEEWVNEDGTFDQIKYAIDTLRDNPNSRRIVVNAWHPANATVSTLPPCHFTFVFNVQNGKLNTHLTQRSGDIALGIPFNIAAYSILTHVIANQVGLEVGKFSHTIVDAHIYAGKGKRGEWYKENLDIIRQMVKNEKYETAIKYIEENAPENKDNLDHIPGLLKQITREPYDRPELIINDENKNINELDYEDIHITNYKSHPGIDFGVAE